MTTEKNTTELEEAYRKFLRLYERLAADRLTISKQGETLGKIIDELKAEAALATEFKVHVRQDVVETLKKTAIEIGSQIKSSIQEPITNELNDTIRNLKTALNTSREALSESTRTKNENILYKCLATVFGGCLVLIVILGAFYFPKLYFTSKQVGTYQDGVLLESFWHRLPKKEQIRLWKLGRGYLPPEENSMEWIKQHHPKLDDAAVQKKFDEQEK